MSDASSVKRLAVVVGATGEIGRVIARRLADEGLRVLAVARSEEAVAALGASHPGIVGCAADIGDDACVVQIRSRLDAPVAIVVHAAGVPTAGGVLEVPTASLCAAVDIKVGGMLRLVRAVDPWLAPHSRLVAIGGHYGFEPTAYAATAGVANAGLTNLVRQLSWAYGPRGVTAHLVAPGPADTERLQRVAGARARRDGSDAQTVLRQMREESAIGAFTTPQQVAWAIAMLLDECADAMAGSTMFLDAGRRRGTP